MNVLLQDIVAVVFTLYSVAGTIFGRLLFGKEWAQDFGKRVFAQKIMPLYHEPQKAKDLKKNLYSELWKLKEAPRVLEIGPGSGSSLDYLPPGTTYLALDPNVHFKDDLTKNIEKHTEIKVEELHVGFAEDMHMISSESLDAVVSTFVFCSVADVKKTFQEIARVLKPGGKLYFFEHVVDHKKSSLRYVVQKLLMKTRLWPIVTGHCSFRDNAATFAELEGLRTQTEKVYCERFLDIAAYFVAPVILGTAEKPVSGRVESSKYDMSAVDSS